MEVIIERNYAIFTLQRVWTVQSVGKRSKDRLLTRWADDTYVQNGKKDLDEAGTGPL